MFESSQKGNQGKLNSTIIDPRQYNRDSRINDNSYTSITSPNDISRNSITSEAYS